MSANRPYQSVLQVTDPHILAKPESTMLGVNTAHYFKEVLALAFSSDRYDLCLLTGDLAQEPCRASYQYLLNALEQYATPSLCLPGNHDDLRIMQTVLNTNTINCNKRYLFDNWQIIALDSQIFGSASGFLSASELDFLVKCLQENPTLNALIAVHHHCLPTGSRWMDTMLIHDADELFDTVKQYPQVKAIVNGHIHQVMELEVNNVKILTTPSTCFQFKPNSESFALDDKAPGYRWLRLFADGSLETGVERLPQAPQGLEKRSQGY